MSVIATLDRKRKPYAKSVEQIRRPWPQRDHAFSRVDRSLICFNTPAVACTVQRARIAYNGDPAECSKARGVGARDPERITHARRLRPEHSVRKNRMEGWLEREGFAGVERLQRQAKP